MNKKIISILAAVTLTLGLFSGCGKSDTTGPDVEIANFTAPIEGEKIAVITFKDFGEVKVKLFPEYAPIGVENFIGLAEMGYYDELTIHRAEKDFCIQGGDPKGNGSGGKSITGEPFAVESSEKLRNFTGAVAYANSGPNSNGSQFYIIDNPPEAFQEQQFDLLSENGIVLPNNVREKYKEVGGVSTLDGDYTVFGQVIEGMDVVSKIANTEVVESSTKPVNQVLIETVKIVEYKK